MPTTKRIAEFFPHLIVTHPKWVLSVFLLCAVALGWHAQRFRIDASADTLLTQGDTRFIQTEMVNRRYAPQEFLLVAYKPKNRPVLSQETFDVIEEITGTLRTLDRVESVRSILNVPIFSLVEGDLSSQTDSSEWTIEKRDFDLADLPKAFAGHPIYEDLIINKDQTATALQVLFKGNKKLTQLYSDQLDIEQKLLHGELTKEESRQLEQLKARSEPLAHEMNATRNREIEAIRGIMVDYEKHADIFLGGVQVLGYQLVTIIKNDLVVFGIGIAAMISLILYLLFTKFRWVMIPLICCVFSTCCTMGLFGLLNFKATVMSANFISLQFILTLAIVMHLIMQYREYCAAHFDWDQARLVQETLIRTARPVFYSGFTTIVGFASLLTCDIQPIISFGWMMMIAMIFSGVVSLTLFPAVMALCRKEEAPTERKFSGHILNGFKTIALKHPRIVVGTSLVLMLASVAGVFFLDVENSFINYFRDRTRVHQELTFIDQEFGGSTPLDIVYTPSQAERKEDLMLTADAMQTMQKIQDALEKREAIGKVLSVVNFTELARQVNDNMPLTEYEVSALYWTLEEPLRNDLFGAFVAQDNGDMRISARIKDTTEGLDRAELLAGIEKDLDDAGVPKERYVLANLFVLYQDILHRLFKSQILTLGTAFGVLFLTFLLTLRSVRLAAIGIVPSILPTIALLGLMGWSGITLDIMTITIASITLGISVDDTIHYILRYLEELHTTPEQAVERTHSSVGYAMLYTSLIIILGFSLLSFSNFVPSVLFGLLTSLVMAMALIYNLCLLPVLLRHFVKKPA